MSNKDQPKDIAARVMLQESQALSVFAEQMPADFDAAVQMILGIDGRVVVSGMGKSGHIGHKIAATLASTGTPSFFVHPAEASHGDLGMITEYDACIVISNSGETTELRDLLTHARRFSIPLIGISKNSESTLMRAADYQFTLPQVSEACSIGMAPTTSTTLTLALGDALAIALMEVRGFVADDFRVFHPGGKLGAQLASVGDLMYTGERVPLVDYRASMDEALGEMSQKAFGTVGLLKDGVLCGVITDGDLRRNLKNLSDKTAEEVSSPDPACIGPDELASVALSMMNERRVKNLFVVDEKDTVLGYIDFHACLRAGVEG